MTSTLDIGLLRRLAVRVSESGAFLERAVSGEAVVIQADTAWELFHRLTREEAIEYLDKRASQGFNAVLAVFVPELDAKPLADAPAGTHFGPSGASKGSTEVDSAGSALFYPNRYGQVPLVDDDPYRPNEKYFEHIDWVIQCAAERGILVFAVPTWTRYVNKGWAGGPVIFDAGSARSYGAFIGRRYPYLPKLLGGDSNPIWIEPLEFWGRFRGGGRKPDDLPLPRVDDLVQRDWTCVFEAFAEGVISTETTSWRGLGDRPMLTFHPTSLWLPNSKPATAASFFGHREWLQLDACQTGHSDFNNIPFEPKLGSWNARSPHQAIEFMRRASIHRPVIDLEPHYEGMYNGLQPRSGYKWSAGDIRAGAWQSILAGACGVSYGSNPVWQMYDPSRTPRICLSSLPRDKRADEDRLDEPFIRPVLGLTEQDAWRSALDLPGPQSLRILSQFLRELGTDRLRQLTPSQHLLVSSEAPPDTSDSDGRIDVAAISSSMIIAHSGRGFAFDLMLDNALSESTHVVARWFDPRTGHYSPAGRLPVTATPVTFSPPSTGTTDDDWVLVIDSDAS